MKILHLNYSDQIGGAAVSVMRLHKSLLKKKIKSNLLVSEKTTNEINVLCESTTLSKMYDLLKKAILRNISRFAISEENQTFSMNFLKGISSKKINLISPDVLNLHWISNEMISLKDISKINVPIVWTIVDMWLFCGGEHWTSEERYVEGYKKSNRQNNVNFLDLNRLVWVKKKKYIKNNIKIVCISNWLAEKARKSSLLKEFDIRVIHCPIDTNIWKPIDKKEARKILGIEPEKNYILFGATGGTKNKRKGFDYILKALNDQKIVNKNFDVIVFGEEGNSDLNIVKRKIHFKKGSFYGNDLTLRLIYSSADLLIAPSILEGFGQVATEAGACETPTVAFNNTGFEDVIEHKKTGYLAKYKDEDDFINGILWSLDNLNNNLLGKEARKNIIDKFSYEKISEKYIELYNQIISNK